MISISFSVYITLMIACALWILGGIVIWPNYKRSGNSTVSDFAQMLIWSGAGAMIMDIDAYNLQHVLPVGWFKFVFVLGGFIKTVGLVYMIRLLFNLIGKYQKVTWWITIFVLITTFLMKFTNVFGFILKGRSGIIFPNLAVGYYAMAWFGPAVVIPSLWVLIKSLSSPERRVKIRGTLVGLAFLMYFANLQACGAGGIVKPFSFTMPSTIGAIIVMLALIYVSKRERIEEALGSSAPISTTMTTEG